MSFGTSVTHTSEFSTSLYWYYLLQIIRKFKRAVASSCIRFIPMSIKYINQYAQATLNIYHKLSKTHFSFMSTDKIPSSFSV
jgi:hypothetical protein